MKRYTPVTPAGTPVHEEAASTFEGAKDNLLKAAAHMPYDGWAGFYERGYRIYKDVKGALYELDINGKRIGEEAHEPNESNEFFSQMETAKHLYPESSKMMTNEFKAVMAFSEYLEEQGIIFGKIDKKQEHVDRLDEFDLVCDFFDVDQEKLAAELKELEESVGSEVGE